MQLKLAILTMIACAALLVTVPSGALAKKHAKPGPGTGTPTAGQKAGKHAAVKGKIVSSTDNTLTIQTKDGTSVTVNLLDKTKYIVDGKPAQTKPEFKADD